ncbi:hypothetical protein LA080_004519 [Diaporthe eres]|nr:hypothetical protein LA080_004519 [Diaporthe eres]
MERFPQQMYNDALQNLVVIPSAVGKVWMTQLKAATAAGVMGRLQVMALDNKCQTGEWPFEDSLFSTSATVINSSYQILVAHVL